MFINPSNNNDIQWIVLYCSQTSLCSFVLNLFHVAILKMSSIYVW